MSQHTNIISDKRMWVIMSKDRTLIAKGTTFRHLVPVNNVRDQKRLLTYRSKSTAENAFTKFDWFYDKDLIPDYDNSKPLSDYLEAVEVSFKVEIVQA
jgi:hypothetical protein